MQSRWRAPNVDPAGGAPSSGDLTPVVSARPFDAEAPDPWRQLRWTVRRWPPSQIWRRLRLPLRRRRWARELVDATAPFAKSEFARATPGPALVFGEFSAATGLGHAAAYDLDILRRRHSAVKVIDITPYRSERTPRPLRLGRFENVYFLCQPDTYGLVCRLIEPREIADAWRIGRLVWETPHFPESWRFVERFLHEAWAPSRFCVRAFNDSLELRVRVVPHAVKAPPDPGIDMRARLGVPPDAFMGLAIMDIVSCPARKNPWEHVRAWRDAFDDSDEYVLVMKIRVGKRTRCVLDELREMIGPARNIIMVSEELTDDEIAALHHAADLYLSLHRAEGFALNILEALLIGKTVVATDWSANAEYGPRFPSYVPAPYTLTRYRDWTGHYPDGNFLWAEPRGDPPLRRIRERRLALAAARADLGAPPEIEPEAG